MGFEYTERWPQIIEYFDDKARAGDALNKRDVDLEAFLRRVGGGELTFTYPAGLTVSTSVKASLPQGTVVKGAVAHLKVPSGQGTVQLSILYNGSSVGSISIPAGQSFGQVTFANPVTTGARQSSLWQISITAAGSGGSGLVVHLTV